jgi:hypothetical protein
MRTACLDHDVVPDSYALISSPRAEGELLTRPAFTGGSVVGLPATETSRGHDIRHSRALEIDNQVIGPQCCSPPAGYLIPTKIMFGTSQESLTGNWPSDPRADNRCYSIC